MKSLVWAEVHPQAGSISSRTDGNSAIRRRHRFIARLGILGAAMILAVALTPAAAVAAPATPQVAASSDWPQFHNDATRAGDSTAETTISASNVAGLGVSWSGVTGGQIGYSSPVIANGVVYVTSENGYLYAFAVGCNSGGGSCTPLWHAVTASSIEGAPAVDGGVVYVGSMDHKLYAFDAAGVAQCAVVSGAKVCSPLWTGTTGGIVWGSPTIANGFAYVTSMDGKLYAFATSASAMAGTCTGTAPTRTCNPLWTAVAGASSSNGIMSSAAVANGGVYVTSMDGYLYVFDGSGSTFCSGSYPTKTCQPVWRANDGSTMYASPTVANGFIYTADQGGTVYAYQAPGVGGASCSGVPIVCLPVWYSGSLGTLDSSPAVADGVVYVGADSGKLYAFDAYGSLQHCVNEGPYNSCSALWKGVTGGPVRSSPAVANGVVYVGSQDRKVYAYQVGCGSGGATCPALWTSPATGGLVDSSPAVANGVVYVGSRDDNLYAYSLPGVVSQGTYHAITPTRVLDTRYGTGGLSGPFTNHAARSFTVSGVPSNATAVTGNLTVTGQTSSGYLYIGPVAANSPGSSTLNFPVGDDRANAVTVQLGAGGSLSITFVAPKDGPSAQAIFDVTGYFTPDTTGATYHAITPARALDTRYGTGGLSGPFTNHAARSFTVSGVPSNATAVTGNLTVTGQTSSGYLYIGPVAANNPGSSTLNFPVGDDRANAVTVQLGAGGTLSITFVAPKDGPSAQAIFDVTGYFTN